MYSEEDIELAWAAGFFDGEGSSYFVNGKYPNISISQTDPRVLERFQRAVGGVGGVYGPYKNTHKPVYQYNASHRKAVEAMNKILPFLGEIKTEQWEKAVTGYSPKERCQEPDHIAGGFSKCKACRRIAERKYYEKKKKIQQSRNC